MRRHSLGLLVLIACSGKSEQPPAQLASPPSATTTAAAIQPRALTQLPWLIGTFRGTGADGTVQDAFFERYSLADDSTLIVESFKDSTLAGPVDSTRYEVRRDSLTNPGAHRYIATSITPDSITFGPLVGVKNGFLWRKGDSSAWTAVIVPPPGADAKQRFYRMARIR
jgi:hypothetical protein